MSLEQSYYALLTRLDHPVFAKDFSDTTTIGPDSPLNSVINLVIAKQLVKLRGVLDEMLLNAFPNTADALDIDEWEETYFGFVKSGVDLSARISQLVAKYNKRYSMSVPDVLSIAEAITGVTPTVVRQLGPAGWVLGEGILGFTTILASDTLASLVTYLVIFMTSVDSVLLAELDAQLTKIEKAGSTHKILAPVRFWILGQGTLSVDTTLE